MNRSTPLCAAACRHQSRAAHVVLHRFARVLFHQRHVLVRSCMEDDLGPMRLHHLGHARFIRHVADDREQPERWRRILQLHADLVEAVLVSFEHQERRGLQERNLAAELGPDRAARARDHDAPPLDQLLKRPIVEPDRRPRQEVFHGQASDLPELDFPIDDVAQIR